MLDRALQRQILDLLKGHYPRSAIPVRDLDLSEEEAAANLRYLEEHGLCESGVTSGADGHFAFGARTSPPPAPDFLEDDGGLSAILGVVTVRLHADTIRALIDAKIETSSLPAEEKSRLRKVLA